LKRCWQTSVLIINHPIKTLKAMLSERKRKVRNNTGIKTIGRYFILVLKLTAFAKGIGCKFLLF
jgi:hypothetical protein